VQSKLSIHYHSKKKYRTLSGGLGMRGITCSVLICVLLSLTSVSLGAADVAELRRKCEAGKRKDCEKLAAFHQKTCSAANIEACEEYLSVARRAGLMWNAPSISPDQLFDAAKAGDVMAVVSALSAGASVGSLTPTRQAIWALGKPDYSPTGSSGLQGEGWSALTFAAENGHLSVARCLVAAGVDVNVADASGATPIMHAIWAHHPEVVGYLADHGASTKEKKFGMTMIMLAAASSCPACIDELVAHGHKADERTSDGRTPLFFVGEGGNDDAIAGTIASLRKAGVDARATDASGATALVAMLRNPPSAFRREQIARIAPMLVDAGTDVWLRDLKTSRVKNAPHGSRCPTDPPSSSTPSRMERTCGPPHRRHSES
jgi:hypothetical protein